MVWHAGYALDGAQHALLHPDGRRDGLAIGGNWRFSMELEARTPMPTEYPRVIDTQASYLLFIAAISPIRKSSICMGATLGAGLLSISYLKSEHRQGVWRTSWVRELSLESQNIERLATAKMVPIECGLCY